MTFGPFSLPDNETGHIDLRVQVAVDPSQGVIQNATNAVTLFQNGAPVDNSNADGEACAGAAVTFALTPGTTTGLRGNAVCFSGPSNGYAVGDAGFIGRWNGAGLTTIPSGTTENPRRLFRGPYAGPPLYLRPGI